MLRRAWGRSLALLFRRGGALIVPNLQASLGSALIVGAYLLALGLKAPGPVFALLKLAGAYAAWMLFSWLAYAARKAFEKPQFRPGLPEMGGWIRLRGRERSASFAAAMLIAFWIGLALGFYRAAAPSALWAALAFGALALALSAFLGALMLDFALASRPEAAAWPEWKASLLMALAFAPQCLAALAELTLLSGAAAFLCGAGHWWGRLLWAPALALPVFGASLAAAFLVALSDEFLARSHQREAPAYEPFHFRELIRPWR